MNPVESWANAWLDRRAARRRRRAWEQHTEQALRNAHPSARCPLGCGMPVWDRQIHLMLWHAPRRPRGPEDRPEWADQ